MKPASTTRSAPAAPQRRARRRDPSASRSAGARRQHDRHGIPCSRAQPRAGQSPVGEDEHDRAAQQAAAAPPSAAPAGWIRCPRPPTAMRPAALVRSCSPLAIARPVRPSAGTTAPIRHATGARGRQPCQRGVGRGRVHDERHADARVEGRPDLGPVEAGHRRHARASRRHRPRGRISPARPAPARIARGRLPGRPPPVMCAAPQPRPCPVERVAHGEHDGRRCAWAQQHLAGRRGRVRRVQRRRGPSPSTRATSAGTDRPAARPRACRRTSE